MGESRPYIEEFEESFRQIREDTKEENILQIVLRGHLYIENAIERLLEDALEKPEEILGERFMFMSKLNLAVAMGLISKEVSHPLKYLNNKIRNKYAHNLKFELSDEVFDGWVNKFDKRTKDRYQKGISIFKRSGMDTDKIIEKLRIAVWSLWSTVMNCHMNYSVKPLMEEMEILTRLATLVIKSKDEQTEYLVTRRNEVVQEIGRFTKPENT